MGHDCGCGHCPEKEEDNCGCGHEDALKSSEDKVNNLKKAIADLGYNVEDTNEGIRITE